MLMKDPKDVFNFILGEIEDCKQYIYNIFAQKISGLSYTFLPAEEVKQCKIVN